MLIYSDLSTSGVGKEWIRWRIRAAFPLTRRTPSLWNRCLVDSSSFPVFLAKADEGYTFSFTSLKGGSAFVIEGLDEGVNRCLNRFSNPLWQQWADHRHVQGCVPAPRPAWDENICWLGFGAWEESLLFFPWSQVGTDCHVEDGITQVIVSGNPLSTYEQAKA